MKNNKGFTLIELVATLILASILTAVAVLGIAQGVKGYIFARENTHLSQRAQLAMERIRRETTLLSEVANTSNGAAINFTNPEGTCSIGIDGQTVKLAEGVGVSHTAGDILIGGVNNFSVTYSRDDGSAWNPATPDNIQDLARIDITLTVDHEDEDVTALTFTTTINPRNTGVSNSPTG